MKSLRAFLWYGLALLLIAETVLSQSISVSLPREVTANPGDSVTIPITVGDVTDKGVIAYQATITFNPNILKATAASSAGTLSESFGLPIANTSVEGQIKIGGFGFLPLSGSGALVNLTFDVVGKAGDSTALAFTEFVFNSGDPAAETRNGRFVVFGSTNVFDIVSAPNTFALRQNFPNPFNPETVISFEMPQAWIWPVTLRIFNLEGQPIKTLIKGRVSQGVQAVVWDGKDATGHSVASGVYLYQLASGNFTVTRTMMLIR